MKTIIWEDNKLLLLDQRKLPDEVTYFECKNHKDVVYAIKNMVVRGAPAIGVAAAFGVALAQINGEDINKAAKEIKNTRPTAINLFWAVDRVVNSDSPIDEALKIYKEDVETNKKIGKHGSKLIEDGDVILTHCNAGALACVDYGTALGVIRAAKEEGKNIEVICTETRPLGQGARLSTWEMQQEGINVKLIVDSAAGYLMQKKYIDKVIIGADRVAKGGVINKIGSLMIALSANRYNVPFYVAAPTSTFDEESNVNEIEIEERNPKEVLYYGKCRIAPKNVDVINPAFDIVPSDLITKIITEKGLVDPL
ncbi:translation initiation factor 2B subunit I family (IF-2BI) [Methanothermus fervidus DSM 2088]|uniref:Putative methylthioribose-1-phosphate isomerase n=1 Tax=Methanothermus fervidus (strain ATCC 43054 / DSM 2088 / JCM 10308 / V24 S) TaxID=523846 RepID=E3GWQ1_METFV|nr:S-methyl-5-thioribose-1-phosphate isomerase [Methanothermus fervidus]ADP77970.1 translation initiation factor 2B subunit I family (IF-2BI) [Methanothermus fervidus DSM 2088]